MVSRRSAYRGGRRARRGLARAAPRRSGTRTIALAGVVLGDTIPPLADLFLAGSMIAKSTGIAKPTGPGLTKWLLTRFRDTDRPFIPVAPAAKPS